MREENVDNNSLMSQTSFPEISEETEEFLESIYDSNADLKSELKIEKVEEIDIRKHNTVHSSHKEAMTCGESFPSEPVRVKSKSKKREKRIVKPKEKKYGICPYCGDSYALSSLSLHIRRHTGEKPYKCETCDKAFVELHDLKRHQRMHTGEKPHVCGVCGKAFSQKNKLSRHNLIHTGERPYKCEHCEKAFTQRNELNLHIRRHTGSKPYACGICGECFLTGTFLRNHQKSMSHFEEEKEDRFIKIRVSNPSRVYRNRPNKKTQQQTEKKNL